MKSLKYSLAFLVFALFSTGITTQGFSQTGAEAVEAYNSALERAEAGDFEQAIALLNETISIAEQAGEDGAEALEKAEGQLPQIYYQRALAAYKQFQQDRDLNTLNDAMGKFQETADIADEYGDEQIADRADNVVTQLYYTRSVVQYQQEDFEGAMESLDETLERNPNNAKAVYQKGLVVNKQGSFEEAMELWEEALSMAEEADDSQTVERARDRMRDELVYRGAESSEDDNEEQALEYLERALELDSEYANTHYRLAEVYNKMSEHEQAIEHAERALELEGGGRTDQAKIYFELGLAYKYLNDREAACEAFSNAAYGSFRSPAEHEMEYEVECEETTAQN